MSFSFKDPKLKHCRVSEAAGVHVPAFAQTNTGGVFQSKTHDDSYMVYASSGQMKCFEHGDVGHKCYACSHKQQASAHSSDAVDAKDQAGVATVPAGSVTHGRWQTSAGRH